ncbi:S1 domain-containing RNA-binding protein [Furfurilactobacillus entadae]|uniref:S1 domain-containing RNA-binding protein n=1 Tax=Furfurilactobacillus entadae TaxID=2922307 RepID=UPI0035EA2E59
MAVAIGSKVSGKVTGITGFGAFIDLGEHQSGLVHISQVSNEYVKDIHDVLTVGDEVTVKVLSIENGKIALSIKQAADNATAPSAREHHGHSNDHHEVNREPRAEHRSSNRGAGRKPHAVDNSFDGMMASFLKDSEQRLATIKHNTEGKRGGRGGRRS